MLGIIKDVGRHPEQHFHVGRDANEFFSLLLDPELILSGVDLKSVIQRNLARRKNKTSVSLNSHHPEKPARLEWPDRERENCHLKTNWPNSWYHLLCIGWWCRSIQERPFVCTLNASWLNSTSNFPTTMAAAVCNGRLCGSDLEGTRPPSTTMRQRRLRFQSNTPHVGEEVLHVVRLQVLIAVCVGRQTRESTS